MALQENEIILDLGKMESCKAAATKASLQIRNITQNYVTRGPNNRWLLKPHTNHLIHAANSSTAWQGVFFFYNDTAELFRSVRQNISRVYPRYASISTYPPEIRNRHADVAPPRDPKLLCADRWCQLIVALDVHHDAMLMYESLFPFGHVPDPRIRRMRGAYMRHKSMALYAQDIHHILREYDGP